LTTDKGFSFGPYCIVPSQRLLTREEQAVPIGSRAFDLLAALVEAGGELVSKRALTERVWPNGFVDESALRVHIGILRKALGDGKDGQRFIVNETGRGYRFVAPLRRVDRSFIGRTGADEVAETTLPRSLGPVVGRDDLVESLCEEVSKHRFLTIVGPGGMGKTTVAVAVADRLAVRYDQQPLFVDLAPLADASLVLSTLAALLGLAVADEEDVAPILRKLSARKQLLVFDNCEHLIDTVARLAEAIVHQTQGIDILATSREPLRAEGEWVHRLLPLRIPDATDQIGSAAGALQFTAVQLFAERAQAVAGRSVLTDTEAPFAAEIARRLDGIPLALELAAARVDMFSLQELAARLDDRFSLLNKGRRTAMPRHQTLRATVDWSYTFLSTQAQELLRALSAFRGRFQLEDAVLLCGESEERAVSAALSDLVSKSLVAVDTVAGRSSYRLLETMGAYATEKLREAGELPAIARSHAEFSLSVAKRATSVILEGDFARQRAYFTGYLDDLREALSWAFSPGGDRALGTAIAASAGSLWFQLSLLTEYRQMAERALAAISGSELEESSTGMLLLTAYGQAEWHTRGASAAMLEAFSRTLELAEQRGCLTFQERAHWGLWNTNTLRGDYHAGLAHAERLEALWPQGQHQNVVDRLKSRSLNYLGRQDEAIEHASRVLTYATEMGMAPAHGLAFIEPVVARSVVARAEWLRGFPDRALLEATLAIEEMRATDHALSICYALAVAGIPVALWAGNVDLARSRADELRDCADRHGLVFWRSWSGLFDLASAWRAAPAPQRLSRLGIVELEHLCTWGIAEAVPLLATRIEAGEGEWCLAELLRMQAEVIYASGDADSAASYLDRAREAAERGGDRSWLLRIAITESRWLIDAGRLGQAHASLASTYDAFTEGFATADLKRAAAMLLEIESHSPRPRPQHQAASIHRRPPEH
jgi:predicted ATPase/DNA-binding winged helix-turn-helix (wHTH) protein